MQFEYILLSIVLIGFFLIFYFLQRKFSSLQNQSSDKALMEWLKVMQASVENTNKTLNDALSTTSTTMVQTLQENSRQLNDRLDKASAIIRDVGKEVGQMSEIGRGMRDLQDFLKSPKLRGNIGEEILKDLIGQMFPKNCFHLQYQFKSGERVDAAIKTDAGILPIDSKFPMESFQRMMAADGQKELLKKEFSRDVKKHVDSIAKKYILPDEGTMDFALMYVPSESVYYELACMNDVLDYARRQRVYLVSPTTLYAHLQTILLSFEGKKIETRSREVFKLLRALQVDYEKVNDNMQTLGKHLTNATAQYSNVTSGFVQLGNKLHTTKHLDEEEIDKIEEIPQQRLLS
ncbi:MAG: DNA recombination protein RmuC [Candidatus Levybacteria bacterium]|nr:DNA recombination protein RmuC [Candidatus Levybacteria bacterium]